MIEFFKNWNPTKDSQALVIKANEIISDFEQQGYTLTLRQLYYQFVGKDLIPNTEKSYKNLGNVINKARLAGLISWRSIEDRNRSLNDFWVNEDPQDRIASLPNYIRFDQWARQDHYVEVWVEKEALGNVVSRACNRLLVPNMACKGYLSASEAWRAGKRFEDAYYNGKQCVMIHLGDHDPSGIDMTRDNSDRLFMLSNEAPIKVERIALNMDQIEEYQPPPNPAKLSDTRARDYINKYGRRSWELDALEPRIIEDLITKTINNYINPGVWEDVLEDQAQVEDKLRKLGDNWESVEDFLSNIED